MSRFDRSRRALKSASERSSLAFENFGEKGKSLTRRARDSASSASTNMIEKTTEVRNGINFPRDRIRMSIMSSQAISVEAKDNLIRSLNSTYDLAASKSMSAREQALSFTTGILVSDFSREMDKWLTGLMDAPATIYDKAMDANYISTHIGGGYHRLFDGGHDLLGAIKAGHNASTEDNVIQEAVGTVSAIFKDLVTTRGLPVVTWNQDTFNSVADTLNGTFNIPKSWIYDAVSVNGTELIASCIGVVAIALYWNNEDIKAFSRIVGGSGLAAVASANPLLGMVTLVALAKSFTDARRKGDYSDFVEGLAKGGIGTGVVLGTASFVGGPAVVGILAGICAAVLANKAMGRVEVTEIQEYVIRRVRDVMDSGESPVQPSSP